MTIYTKQHIFTALVRILMLATIGFMLINRNSLHAQARSGSMSIKIIDVPLAGEGSASITKLIGGFAKGPDLRRCKVVLYTHTDTWYIQPTVADPYTEIELSDGRWKNSTHPGAEYAALLVRSSYKPEPTIDKLPGIGGDVLAKDVTPGK